MFGFNKKILGGGFSDVIRCDEREYLIWKWHPEGTLEGKNRKENQIRWGSSLRVKAGEVAVFVYAQDKEGLQDFIEGPYDGILETNNLPILTSFTSKMYNGDSPFQAEVYFINLAGTVQVPFGVPYFDLFDSRFPDLGVPTAVRGKLTFHIKDYRKFIALHRLQTFELKDLQEQIRTAMCSQVKSVMSNYLTERKIPLVQIESQIENVNAIVSSNIKERFDRDFGIQVMAVDIDAVEIDKSSEGYNHLKAVTQDIVIETKKAEAQKNIKDILDKQKIQEKDLEERLRAQREEEQYAKRKQTEMNSFAAYQIEKQAEIAKAGADALGQMGQKGGTEISGNGAMNPVGIGIGVTIGQNIANMVNGAMQNMNREAMPPNVPPFPPVSYFVVVAGEKTGPYNLHDLASLASSGILKKNSFVWRSGMAGWEKAEMMSELSSVWQKGNASSDAADIPPVPKSERKPE